MFTLVYAGLRCVASKGVHSVSRPLRTLPESLTVPAHSAINEDNKFEVVAQTVKPLSKMPYVDQLELKQNYISSLISDYNRELDERCKWLSKRTPSFNPLIHRIRPSLVTEGYENKNTFTIRQGVDGNVKTVGLIVAWPQEGNEVCILPKDGLRLSHYKVAKAFEDFIRSSPLPACYRFDDLGFWVKLTVRSNEKGHVMAIVNVNPRTATEIMIEEQQELLRQYFVEGPGAECQLHSLYFQACPHTTCSDYVAKFILLHGEKYLEEEVNGWIFHISPGSFFRPNTKMAEILYDNILSVAKLSKQTTLLDLGCGIGVTSIMASPFVRGTVGIDQLQDSIDDAIYNASQNLIHTAYFIPGRIERHLERVLTHLGPSPDIVAVIDPGRSGVGNDVLHLLRNNPQIRTVVYVSCKLDHAMNKKNIMTLIKPGTGTPFRISQVMPLDILPHTFHYEVILTLNRSIPKQ